MEIMIDYRNFIVKDNLILAISFVKKNAIP